MTSTISPTTHADRIEILDIIRGFALLGILIMNIINFSGYDLASDTTKSSMSTYAIDEGLISLARVFFDSKYYTIFSILFGIGFYIIMTRLKKKTDRWRAVFYRRLLILAIIGYLHMQFLWSGDILLAYALMGFLLPLFADFSDRKLIISSGIVFLLSPTIHVLDVYYQFMPGQWLENIGIAIDTKNGIPEDDGWRTYLYDPNHGWKEFWYWNQPGPIFRFSDLLNSNRFFKVLGLFLLGFFIGRKNFTAFTKKQRPTIKKVTLFGLIIGIPANLAYLYFYNDGKQLPEAAGLFDSISQLIGGVSLGLAIMGGIAILYFRGFRWLRWFVPMGRMALTNYLMHTVICIILFYSVGFGLGGRFGPSVSFPTAVLIIIFQMILGKFWLKNHSYGPMEWIWRKLTYGKFL